MKSFKLISALIGLSAGVATLSSCGDSSSTKPKKGSHTFIESSDSFSSSDINGLVIYRYQFSENNCNTGPQKTQEAGRDLAKVYLCKMLSDDTLNNNCAHETRKQHFAKRCNGIDMGTSAPDSATQQPTTPPVTWQPTAPQPAPAQEPTSCNVACELAAAGINVINDNRYDSDHNEVSTALAPYKKDILKLKDIVKTVSLGMTDYIYSTQTLVISNGITDTQDLRYLREMIDYSKTLGIEVHVLNFYRAHWLEAKKMLDRFWSRIIPQNKNIDRIEFWNLYSEYNPSRRTLYLRGDSEDESVVTALEDAAKYGPILKKYSGIDIEAGTPNTMNDNRRAVLLLDGYAVKIKAALSKLGFNKIELIGMVASCDINVNEQSKELVFYINSATERACMPGLLIRLDRYIQLTSEIGMPVKAQTSSVRNLVTVLPAVEEMNILLEVRAELAMRSKTIKKILFTEDYSSTNIATMNNGELRINSFALAPKNSTELLAFIKSLPVD